MNHIIQNSKVFENDLSFPLHSRNTINYNIFLVGFASNRNTVQLQIGHPNGGIWKYVTPKHKDTFCKLVE